MVGVISLFQAVPRGTPSPKFSANLPKNAGKNKTEYNDKISILSYMMENGKRPIGNEMAKCLGKALNIGYKVFL